MNILSYWFWFKKNPFRSKEEIKKNQFQLLKKQIENAYKNSKFYKEIWDSANFHPSQYNSIDDMERIPVVSKKDFKTTDAKDITTKGDLSGLYIHKTSGSTGIPLEIYFNRDDLWRKDFMWLRTYLLSGMNYSSKSLVMCDPEDIRKSSWYQKFGVFRNESINIFNDPKENYNRIVKNNFDIMVGYPIDLKMIAKIIIDNKIRVTPKVVYSSAGLLDQDTRNLIEKAFNAPVCDFYGSTEGGCIAFQTPGSGYYYTPSDINYLEIKNGTKVQSVYDASYGEAIITNLWNSSFPVIRYNIGDFIEIDPDIYAENSKINFPRISRIIGKYLDFLIFPNNIVVSPNKIKNLLTDLSEVDSFQVFQDKYEEIEVRVAINSEGSYDRVKSEVQKLLSSILPDTVLIKVKKVESFDRKASRKFKVIESKIGQQYFERKSNNL